MDPELNRRTLLRMGMAGLVGPACQGCKPATHSRRNPLLPLSASGISITRSPIVIDLNSFNPEGPMPGWDGRAAVQGVRGAYPSDRDLVILGHQGERWMGRGGVRGGRNVLWLGGCYNEGPFLIGFIGDACVEGVLVRPAFAEKGRNTGDGISIIPHSVTRGSSRIFILNCRIENIDGFYDQSHGDCFQMPPQWQAPNGYGSSPKEVTIERFTGSTGYQGLFLPNQHFDNSGPAYAISCQKLNLIDVNLRKTRELALFSDGRSLSSPTLIYMIDMSPEKRGDKPYPKRFRNVFVEPFANEGIDGCIYPSRRKGGGINRHTKSRLTPVISVDGRTARYPAEMLLDGVIQLGPPEGGDFAIAAGPDDRGGQGIPGIGYRSTGYNRG